MDYATLNESFSPLLFDNLVKSLQSRHSRESGSPVPLKMGSLDSRVRGNDENGRVTFYETINNDFLV